MKRKLRNNSGVTLVEMLAVTVILILLGLMLNTGLMMAVGSYHDLTAEAEVWLLLSTAADALTDELRYARNVQTVPAETEDLAAGIPSGEEAAPGIRELDSYNSDSFGPLTALTLGEDGQIYAGGRRLLPPGAYRNGDYKIEKMEIIYVPEDACFQVTLKVIGGRTGSISAEAAWMVRCLNDSLLPADERGETEGLSASAGMTNG